jgi:heme oxygenase
MTLSQLLRERTADVHRDAERSAFVERFVRGQLDRDLYARHLRALYDVYGALEDALDRRQGDERLRLFHLPALWRRSALETDLAFLRGAAWRDEVSMAAARAYAERIGGLEAREPLRLVSHAYVRYLGDLSGGQVLKKLAARQLALDGDGLRFYEFPDIPDPAAFKDDFRRRLDGLPLRDGEQDELVEEAREAFRQNAAIFQELL